MPDDDKVVRREDRGTPERGSSVQLWYETMKSSAMKILDEGKEPTPVLFLYKSTPKPQVIIVMFAIHKDNWRTVIQKLVKDHNADDVALCVPGFGKVLKPNEKSGYTGTLRDDPRAESVLTFQLVTKTGKNKTWVCSYVLDGDHRSLEPDGKVVSHGPWEQMDYAESRFLTGIFSP